VQYIIPNPPDDKAAVAAIKRHYKSLSASHANEYFWVAGKWVSSEQYFDERK